MPPAVHGLGAQKRHLVLVALGENLAPGLSQTHNDSFIRGVLRPTQRVEQNIIALVAAPVMGKVRTSPPAMVPVRLVVIAIETRCHWLILVGKQPSLGDPMVNKNS